MSEGYWMQSDPCIFVVWHIIATGPAAWRVLPPTDELQLTIQAFVQKVPLMQSRIIDFLRHQEFYSLPRRSLKKVRHLRHFRHQSKWDRQSNCRNDGIIPQPSLYYWFRNGGVSSLLQCMTRWRILEWQERTTVWLSSTKSSIIRANSRLCNIKRNYIHSVLSSPFSFYSKHLRIRQRLYYGSMSFYLSTPQRLLYDWRPMQRDCRVCT